MLRQKVGVGERKQRYERVDPDAQLELQQHRDQRAALPPAAAQRPPRQPDPALPVAARLRGVAGAADRVRRDDRARDRARRLAPGDGPAGARALRRRPEPGQPAARASGTRSWRSTRRRRPRLVARQRRGRDGLATVGADEVLAARCPGCGYTYEVDAGDEHEGFAAGTAWADDPGPLVLPRLRRAREGRLRAADAGASRGRRLPRLAVHDGGGPTDHCGERIVEAAVGADHRRRLVAGDDGPARRPGRREPADGLQRDRHQAGAWPRR